MLKRWILLAAMFLVTPALRGQHAVTAPLTGSPHPGFTFTVTGYLAPGATGDLPLPMALLERLFSQPSLVELETGPTPAGRAMVRIRFVFAELEAFRQWYADERTTTLLRDVRERTAGGSYESYVSYRPRLPHPS